tara:strand:+ start:164 stop:412 length:249 start_codon:yes stop_codon:yes gene_type:complete
MTERSDPSQKAVAVTKSDSTSLLLNGQPPRAIYVAGTGNLNLKFGDAPPVLFTTVQAGSVLPVRPTLVMSTSTTATGIVALY